jgi:hypothetical protein
LLALLGVHHILHVSRIRVKRKINQLSGFSAYPDGSPSKVILTSGFLLYVPLAGE